MARESVTPLATSKRQYVWLAKALNHSRFVSFILATAFAFGVWVLIDYEAYYGGYDRGKRAQIYTMHNEFIERGFKNGKLANYNLKKAEVSLTVIDMKNSNIVYKYDYTSRANAYKRSEISIESNDHNFTYGYYIKPKLWVGITRSLTFSMLPDCFLDNSEFSLTKWFDELLGRNNYLRSTTFYIPLFIFWFLFSVIAKPMKRYADELIQTKEMAIERLKTLESELENDKKAINKIKDELEAGNKALSEKENRLAQTQKELDEVKGYSLSSSEERNLLTEKIAKLEAEIARSKSDNESLQTRLESAVEKLQEGKESKKDLEKAAKIMALIEKFDIAFEKRLPRGILNQISESYYFYEIQHEYMLLTMYGWCVSFERIVMERAKNVCPYENPNNLCDAIDIIARYADKGDSYKRKLRRIQDIRNKLAHGDTSVITTEVVRELHAKLFGKKITDGLFYDLATLKIKGKK
ncbi:MAG: hypothetical protein LBO72_03380 [Helicobacteraceae bacterium]|jgi:hypothetical protein|nr:hypothetical protein [Helicobacteraceae bacterium]